MMRLVFSLATAVLLSSVFANILLSNGLNKNMTLGLQFALAANIINNQSTSVNNCNPSDSTCTTSSSQTRSVGVGDGNIINQRIEQRNNICNEDAICDIIGTQDAAIAGTANGGIFDFGTGGESSQTINTNNIGNDNEIQY
jgi:hypothetical protein